MCIAFSLPPRRRVYAQCFLSCLNHSVDSIPFQPEVNMDCGIASATNAVEVSFAAGISLGNDQKISCTCTVKVEQGLHVRGRRSLVRYPLSLLRSTLHTVRGGWVSGVNVSKNTLPYLTLPDKAFKKRMIGMGATVLYIHESGCFENNPARKRPVTRRSGP
jgi:hypothetical protein